MELFLVALCCLASYSSICGLGGPKVHQFFLWCNLQWELSKQIPEQNKVSSMMPRVIILLLSFLISLRIMSTIISLPLLPKLFLIFTPQTTSFLFRNRKPNKLYPIFSFPCACFKNMSPAWSKNFQYCHTVLPGNVSVITSQWELGPVFMKLFSSFLNTAF